MKILKLAIALMLTFNIASAKDTTSVLSIPYSFVSGNYLQETDAKFFSYGDTFKNSASLAEAVEGIFKADPETLATLISDAKDLGKAQAFITKMGKFAPEKFTYTIVDGDTMLALGGEKFMSFNKYGKWEVSKKSALYSFLAKNADKVKVEEKNIKQAKTIEMFCADLKPVETMENEQALEVDEVFFYYCEVVDAFFAKNFDKFVTFLDENSTEIFEEKIGDAIDTADIAKAMSKELKEQRVYRNIANLGTIYAVFYESYSEGAPEHVLTFSLMRDISCGVELMNYFLPAEPVLLDYISRQ